MANVKPTSTADLIDELSADLQNPSETKNWPYVYWISWFGWITLMASLTYYSTIRLPDLSYAPESFTFSYLFESILWVVSATVSAAYSFRLAFPGRRYPIFQKVAIALLVLSLAYSLIMAFQYPIGGSLAEETEFERTRCGIFIALSGVFSVTWMLYTLSKAAPTRLMECGFWSAAASGGTAMMLMHVVCRQENVMHLMLWHFIPLLAIYLLGAYASRKILNW